MSPGQSMHAPVTGSHATHPSSSAQGLQYPSTTNLVGVHATQPTPCSPVAAGHVTHITVVLLHAQHPSCSSHAAHACFPSENCIAAQQGTMCNGPSASRTPRTSRPPGTHCTPPCCNPGKGAERS